MVTAVEYERGFGFVQFGESFSNRAYTGKLPVNSREDVEENERHGDSGFAKFLFQVRVIGQSQIIVRGEIQHGVPVTDDGQALCIHGR